MSPVATATDTTSLRTRVQRMFDAKVKYDAATLMEFFLISKVARGAEEYAINPEGCDAVWKLAGEVRSVAYASWKCERDSVRQWGAEARATDTAAENALGVRYANTLTDAELSEVINLATSWSDFGRHTL